MDRTKTKVENLNLISNSLMPTTFQIVRNQSDRSPELPRNPARHYSNLKTKTNKIYFQNTRTPDSD